MTVCIANTAGFFYTQLRGLYKQGFDPSAIINILSYSVIILSCPLLISQLTARKFTIAEKIIFPFLAFASYPVLFTLFIIAPENGGVSWNQILFIMDIQCTIAVSVILFYLIQLFFIQKKISNKRLIIPIRIFQILYILFLPGMIMCAYIPVLSYPIYKNTLCAIIILGSFSSFYSLWNIAGIFYFLHYLLFQQNSQITGDISEKLLKQYQISERETDVIQYLLEGLSYLEIGNKLFISIKTVKTHLHNIYKKTATRNKIELANRLRDLES